MATTGLQDTFVKRQQESADKIGNLYNLRRDSQNAEAKMEYDKGLSDVQAAQAKIAPQYQTQANQLGTQYERNRRNLNLQNMMNGMGTGTAVQQQEALNTAFQNNYAALRANELNAQAQANQKIADLGVQYQNTMAKKNANAENDKAAALVENQNKQNDWYDQQAKLLAGYGDFSAYERMYGPEATQQMKDVWIIQNPRAALGAGLIDAKKFKEITGENP